MKKMDRKKKFKGEFGTLYGPIYYVYDVIIVVT